MTLILSDGAQILKSASGVLRDLNEPLTGVPQQVNLVAHWDAITAAPVVSAGNPTTWPNLVAGNTAVLTDVGDETGVGTGPAGTPAWQTSADGGMQATGPFGWLPTGTASRTVAICYRPSGDQLGYSGFGWGQSTATDKTSFVVGTDGDGNAAVDYRVTRLSSTTNIENRDCVLSADYDGTDVTLYLDGVEIASETVALATTADFLNMMIVFSLSSATAGRVMAAAAWDTNLTPTQHAELNTYWQVRHLNDVTAPVISSVVFGATKTSVSLSFSFTSDETGVVDVIATTNAAAPTTVQIEAGLDGTGAAAAYHLAAEPMSTTNTGTATGLTAGTAYYFFASARDNNGNATLVDGGASVSTEAADVTAPVLSAASIAKVGSTGYSGSVTTDEGNGTLYIFVRDTAGTPANSLVKTGETYAISSTGAKAFSGSWSPNTTGYGWALHVDAAGNEAGAATSLGTFTTDAASASDLAPDVTETTLGGLDSRISSWAADWNGTSAGLGLTDGDERCIQCDFSTGSTVDLTGLTFPQRVTIRMGGTFGETGTGLSKRPTSTYAWTGRVKMDNSTNIRLAVATIEGDRRVSVNGATDCTVERVFFKGSYTTPPTSSGNAPTQRNAMSGTDTSSVSTFAPGPGTTTNFVMKDSLVQGYDDAGIMWTPNCTGTTFDGVVFDVIGHDTFKIGKGTHTNFTIKRCWGPRLVCGKSGANYHEDFCQVAATEMTNFVIEDCVWWKAIDDWYGSAIGVGQGLHGDDDNTTDKGISIDGMTVQRNVSVMDAQPCKINVGFNPGSIFAGTRRGDHNLFLGAANKPSGSAVSDQVVGAGFNSETNNVCTTKNGTSGSAGANATIIDMGPDSVNPDTSGYTAHITGIPVAMATSMFGVMLPKAGSPLHWDYTGADKCNAGDRLKQIFNNGDHPGNVGWPVAPIWEARYNDDSAVTSGYTGSYDADGLNV